jgi:hypothetical protein
MIELKGLIRLIQENFKITRLNIFIFFLLLIITETKIRKATAIGDLTNQLFMSGDTVSAARSSAENKGGDSLNKSSNALSQADTGGKSFSSTDNGIALAKSEGSHSLANSQADEGKTSVANARTDSNGIAIASALNNSSANAISTKEGKALASADKNASANANADGKSDAVALATDNGKANASARSTNINIGISDSSSNVNADANSEASSLATASGDSIANADSNSLAGSIAIASRNSSAKATSDSKSVAVANASENGVADSTADSVAIALASADNGNTSNSNSENLSISSSKAGNKDWDFNSPISNPLQLVPIGLIYLGDPLKNNLQNEGNGPLLADNKDPIFSPVLNNKFITDWESIYKNLNPDSYNYFLKSQIANLNEGLKNFETFNPIQTDQNSLILPMSKIKDSLGTDSNLNVNWIKTGLVAVDVGMNPEGEVYATGLDGYLYNYLSIENKWEKIEGDFDLSKMVRLDVNFDGTPYVVTYLGDVYYLNCEHKWQKLPGCARDIGIGRGGEIYKIGCERRIGGFKIYRLICKQSEPIKPCRRYRKKCETCYSFEGDGRKCKWFNVDGAGVRIDVHPNGNPFIINDTGNISFYDGINWKKIPNTNAYDLTLTNEGAVYYVGNDYGVYKITPKLYIDDYTKVKFSKLLNKSAIAVSGGPYSQLTIVGSGYNVYSSWKSGYDR